MTSIVRASADGQAGKPTRPPHDDDHPPLLLRAADVAALTGFSVRAVYRLAAQGMIPGAIRLGRTLRFSRAAVQRWADGGEGPQEDGARP